MSVDTLRRAFELADSGNFTTVGDLRAALRRERFDQVDGNLAGASIQKQLISRMTTAGLRKNKAPRA